MTEVTCRCRCGLVPARKTSSGGRVYYGCSKPISSGVQCGFFADETELASLNTVAEGGSSSLVPQSPKRSGPGPTINPSSLANEKIKRTRSNPQDNIESHSPQSQKRSKVLESAQKSTRQQSLSSESISQPSTLASEHEPLTPSQKRTKIIEAVLQRSPIPNSNRSKHAAQAQAPPRRHQSYLNALKGAHVSTDLVPVLVNEAEAQPGTADYGSSSGLGTSDLAVQHQPPSSYMVLSPKDTRSDILKIADSALSQQEPRQDSNLSQIVADSEFDNGRSHDSHAGVVKADEGCMVRAVQRFRGGNETGWIPRTPGRRRSKDLCLEDERKRFEREVTQGPSPSMDKGKQKAIDCAEDDSKASVMPTAGDRTNVLLNVKEGDSPSIGLTERPHLTSATVSQLVHALGGLPGYVDQLEKTIDIKDMKIQLLENEVARLRARQEELESKLLHIYE